MTKRKQDSLCLLDGARMQLTQEGVNNSRVLLVAHAPHIMPTSRHKVRCDTHARNDLSRAKLSERDLLQNAI